MTYSKENPESIQRMFGSIAKQYDRANGILSFQLHKRWNRALVDAVTAGTLQEPFFDLCCGTGDIALAYLDAYPKADNVTFIDFCPEMLACAKEKVHQRGKNGSITYLQADVQEIPLPENSAKAATMAYGIRNVKDPKRCFREVHRLLSPGATFGILELTRPKHSVVRWGHHLYLKMLLPVLGRLVTSNKEAYSYLCNSIQDFIAPRDLQVQLEEAGFENVTLTSLSGGIATILIGQKTL